jgi:hypothetical protein
MGIMVWWMDWDNCLVFSFLLSRVRHGNDELNVLLGVCLIFGVHFYHKDDILYQIYPQIEEITSYQT